MTQICMVIIARYRVYFTRYGDTENVYTEERKWEILILYQ